MVRKEVTIPIGEKGAVSGILSMPEGYIEAGGTGIIISHGAANDMDNPLIVFLADGLAEAGYVTLRFNFLYRQQNRKSPDSQHELEHTWACVYRFLKDDAGCGLNAIVAAGKSMGGRIASQMVANGMMTPDRLVFFGYPLHAPGKQDRLRDDHLYRISIPMLFFEGTRDPFCDLHTLKNVLGRVESSWDLEIIEGGDHSFDLPKSATMSRQEVYERMVNKTIEWLEH